MTVVDRSPVQVLLISHKTGDVLYSIPVQTITNLQCNKLLNQIGKCALTFVYDENIVNIIDVDHFIEVYVYSKALGDYYKFDTYLIRTTHHFIDNEIEFYAIGGVSLNHLISRRVLDTSVDPNALNGWVTLYGTAHDILIDLANAHFINCSNTSRNFPLMTINELYTDTSTAAIRKRYENLFPLFQEVAAKGNTAFSVERTDGRNLELVIGKRGTDKTYSTNYPLNPATVLSPQFGNLINPTIETQRDSEKNFCYVLGEGDDDSQIVLQFATAATNDSFYNRVEFITLQRNGNSEYLDIEALLTKGVEELRANQEKIAFSYDYNLNDNSLDLEVGDEITVAWDNFREDIEVTEIECRLTDTVFTIDYEARKIEV